MAGNDHDLESEAQAPWGRSPRVLRRDCTPHRGRLLRSLAFLSMGCAWLTFLLWVPGLVGAGLGIAIWRLADDDLAKMRAGLVDPDGQFDTADARSLAIPSFFISLLGLLFCAAPAWQVLNSVIQLLKLRTFDK
jgi:hypothetical protein